MKLDKFLVNLNYFVTQSHLPDLPTFSHLRRWRIRRGDVPYHRGEVFGPERALPLPVVPQRRRVLRGVDRQVLQDLALRGHVPVDAQDVLGGGVAVPREVGDGVDEELAHVAVALGPQVAADLHGEKECISGTVVMSALILKSREQLNRDWQ